MSGADFALFLLAALIIAAVPGPGIFYVAARTLAGGRKAGIASSFGTALGGLVHVVAGGLGISAIILASAQLFTVLKLVGALYLVWLGIRTFRDAGGQSPEPIEPDGGQRAFRDGVVVEALNPKTAAFFLAFIPQFIDAGGGLRGAPVHGARSDLGDAQHPRRCHRGRSSRPRRARNLVRRPHLVRRLRQGSGLFMAGLGRLAGCSRGDQREQS